MWTMINEVLVTIDDLVWGVPLMVLILTGGNMKVVMKFRWLYIFAVFIGPYMTISAVWTIADIFNGLMALPNMIALFALSDVVVKETKAFFNKE